MYRNRRRSRGSNGQWFPTRQVGDQVLLVGDVGANVTSYISPIIADDWDKPPNEAVMSGATAGRLSNALGGGYLIKRIVGSIFIAAGTPTEGNADFGCIVTAGIFVDRVDTTGALQNAAAWNPFIDASAQKRYLWRRTWRLGGFYQPAPGLSELFFPVSNAHYGSIREGTHIDSKVKARVTYEERLWLGIWLANASSGATEASVISTTQHLRMFAKQIRQDNR